MLARPRRSWMHCCAVVRVQNKTPAPLPPVMQQLDVTVVKGPNGVGINVSQDNRIGNNSRQPLLRIGDRIVAVDGAALGHQYIGDVLPTMGDGPFVFTVERVVETATGATATATAVTATITTPVAPQEGGEPPAKRKRTAEGAPAAPE